MPTYKQDPLAALTSAAQRYDHTLKHGRVKSLDVNFAKPLPSAHWHTDNLALLEKYERWLWGGGISRMVIEYYHIPMAGHVFGLTLKHHSELDLDHDLECALEYVKAKGMSRSWIGNCHHSLNKFRRFMRLERGLGEESKETPFDVARVTAGLPLWLVQELERYQHLQQRNWRSARLQNSIRNFWSHHLRFWRYFVEQKHFQKFKDLKRQHVLDYVDHRLRQGYSASGVNADLRYLHTFLLFLQEEGYAVPQSLLKMPGLKQPEPLPRYLTDEQMKTLREEIEQNVQRQEFHARRRAALLVRAAFYLLWQGGMRLGEVEELRLEDLDFAQKRLSVRDGKGRKDRTVYLTETAILTLQEYLAVRGDGSGDHVFLYRNAPVKKDLVRDQIKHAGERVGVKVFPHRLRHTCATQLLNAGCRVTSIQRFLGHKKLSSTMIYARAHDQTVAEDYFAAMERVEQRLEIVPQEEDTCTVHMGDVKVQEPEKLFQLIQQLEMPELCFEERLVITLQIRELFGVVRELEPMMVLA